MEWKDLLNQIEPVKKIKLLSTATTGLDAEDELLAVSLIEPSAGGSVRRTIIKRVDDRDKVLKSQEYHKITPEQSLTGLETEAFNAAMIAELEDSVFFTYNPGFQQKYLERAGVTINDLFNLPLFLKGAMSKMLLFEDEVTDLSRLQSQLTQRMGKCSSIAKLAEQYGYKPTLSELPVEFFCRVLLGLWSTLESLPVFVQGKLL